MVVREGSEVMMDGVPYFVTDIEGDTVWIMDELGSEFDVEECELDILRI